MTHLLVFANVVAMNNSLVKVGLSKKHIQLNSFNGKDLRAL